MVRYIEVQRPNGCCSYVTYLKDWGVTMASKETIEKFPKIYRFPKYEEMKEKIDNLPIGLECSKIIYILAIEQVWGEQW